LAKGGLTHFFRSHYSPISITQTLLPFLSILFSDQITKNSQNLSKTQEQKLIHNFPATDIIYKSITIRNSTIPHNHQQSQIFGSDHT